MGTHRKPVNTSLLCFVSTCLSGSCSQVWCWVNSIVLLEIATVRSSLNMHHHGETSKLPFKTWGRRMTARWIVTSQHALDPAVIEPIQSQPSVPRMTVSQTAMTQFSCQTRDCCKGTSRCVSVCWRLKLLLNRFSACMLVNESHWSILDTQNSATATEWHSKKLRGSTDHGVLKAQVDYTVLMNHTTSSSSSAHQGVAP